MIPIIMISMAIIAGLIGFSRFFSVKFDTKDRTIAFDYKVLSASLCITAIIYVLMYISYGSIFCYILYGLDRFFKVVIMIEVLNLTKGIVDTKESFISVFISIIAYGAAVMYLIDTLALGGSLEKGVFGVYLYPVEPWHRALYFLYYMIYIIILITFIVIKGTSVIKEYEKYDYLQMCIVYSLSAFGFMIEIFIINYRITYLPIALLFNTLTVINIKYLINYHYFISLKPECFENELDPGRTDVVFILNDQMKIIYQNKRAEILAHIFNDIYVDRKISEIFNFTDAAFAQFSLDASSTPFGITAVYPVNGKVVNMVVQHRIDKKGNIVATIVSVYNMEDKYIVEETVEKVTKEEKVDSKNAVKVTSGARALVVDEDILFINVFERLLEQYEISVKSITSGYEAIELVKNNIYDIIFITYEMNESDGANIARNIRKIDGEYYKQVPIVFMTAADINDVYTEFVDAGFNDYLKKPVDSKALGLTLTRWLWQRFDDNQIDIASYEDATSPGYVELNRLISLATLMREQQKSDKFMFCINGMRKLSLRLGLTDISECAYDLYEAITLEDKDRVDALFDRLVTGVRDAITIK